MEADYKTLWLDWGFVDACRWRTCPSNVSPGNWTTEELQRYQSLKMQYNPDNLGSVMCRQLIRSDDLYDCDFNQQLGLSAPGGPPPS